MFIILYHVILLYGIMEYPAVQFIIINQIIQPAAGWSH